MSASKKNPILSALVIPIIIALPTALQATEERASNSMIEEVTVTARKREETAQNVPIPISALTSEQMEARNIVDMSDLERLSPNTDISSSPVNGSALQIFMRGIGQVNWSSTQDPKIGVYVDGVYLSRPQGGLLDLMDVQRVEILRGPQGTLFGRNTTAGLIQIINNKPEFETDSSVNAGFGSDGHRTYGFMFNTALSDNLAARVSFYDKETDGFIKNSNTGKDRGNENSTSYRASLLWELEDYSAQFTYDHFEADERAPLASCRFTGPDNPFAAGGLSFIATIFGSYSGMQANCNATTRDVSIDMTNDESTKSDVDAYTLNQSYDFGWGEITSITAYRDIDNFNGSWGWVMGAGPGTNFLEILDNKSEHKIFSQELRLAGSSDSLDWVVGAYVFKEDSEESLNVPLFRDVPAPSPAVWPFFYAPSGATNPDGSPQTLGDIALATQLYGSRYQAYDVTNKNWAVFAEVTYPVNEKLDLTLGARYTRDDREFTRIQYLYGGGFDPGYNCPGIPKAEVAPGVFVPTSDRCYQDVSYNKTTPRAILSYQLTDDVMIYGSYSLGYSSGGFNQDARMRAYEPEESDNFEFGAKTLLMDGRLRLNATVFHNSYKNQQVTVARLVDGQVTADLINAQEATLTGLEFDVIAQFSDSLAIMATGGYLSGNYDKFSIQDNVFDPVTLQESIVTRDLSDTDFGSNANEKSFDISLQYIRGLSIGGDIAVSLGYGFKDDKYYSLLNVPSSHAPSYWLLDAKITWNLANDKTSISLWGTNLTDKEYVTNLNNQAGDVEIGGIDPGLGMSADYWGDPRRVGLQLKHTF